MRDYSPIQRGELIEECYRKDAEIKCLCALNAKLVGTLKNALMAHDNLLSAAQAAIIWQSVRAAIDKCQGITGLPRPSHRPRTE